MTGARAGGRDAIACTAEQTQLGEGVRWDDRRSELVRVDILAGHVYRDNIMTDGALIPVCVYELPWTVGMIAPIEGDGGWLLGAANGFAYLAPDGSYRLIAEVSSSGTRMNDGACDPMGRFWGGTLANDHHVGGGALYRLDGSGHIEQVLDGLTISNGLGWSPDGATMYLVDSGPRIVYAFDYEAESGAISNQRVLLTMPPEVGSPDGMTVDSAGDLWVAIYGGGQVRRYAAGGELREVLTVPAEQTTCCALAGSGLNRLYVTTATEGWSDEQRRAHRGAGLVYRIDVDAVGRSAAPFQPEIRWWESVQRAARNGSTRKEPPV